jgi:hypothetical protein
MKKTIQAKLLTPLQLKMLDIGAPVIVSCQTLSGETVDVRLQTANLEQAPKTEAGSRSKRNKVDGMRAKGGWSSHGAYVAIMRNGEGK